jgi:hypothetical protein
MLKKTITFKDLDGNDVSEEFYFNLSKAEITEMELSMDGGFSAYLRTIIESKDGAQIMATFKKIITASVGKRSEDGRRLIKNQEVIDDFVQSDAYSVLFMELVTNAEAAASFMQNIVPSDVSDAVRKNTETSKDKEIPAYIREEREPTNKELMEMTPEQIQEAFARRAAKGKDD